jgi:putative nucleotidyltransferase with HDIG domain
MLALSAFPLIYLSEKLFGLVSDLSLLELTDTNTPLLRELAEKAPGTFQHSLQVANLAEAAVLQIGGNPLLIRAGAMYHDIGKMTNPMYFIENQASGLNPHDELGFDESAAIIIGHVKEGIKRARAAKLPETLIDFIRTHHGSSTVQYFYRQHIKNFPESEVDLQQFSYPGPKPFNKETAVLMMADSVEAASRSVASRNRKDLDSLVEKIIGSQMSEHQFEEADITLREITKVKEVFKSKLKDIYHFRVAYPD